MVANLTANVIGAFLAGDMIGVGTQLCMVTADANSDNAGIATLSIEAPLRTSPADLSAITVTKPTATFKLKDDNQAAWRVQPVLYSLALTCEEVFV